MLNFKSDMVLKGRKLSRRMKFQGMDISIETDKGEERHWDDPHSGESGTTKMKYPYGYVRRTIGADGEHIDVYVGPEEDADDVYVIHQMKKPDFKKYDEDKVMMGFESAKQAKAAYLMHYDDDKFFGTMDTMSVDEFKDEFISKALGGDPMVAVVMIESMDNPEYIEHKLKEVAGMSDGKIMDTYREIWGDGYTCRNADPDLIRDEMIGFLLDQRDKLQEQQFENPAFSPNQDTLDSSSTSMSSLSEREEPFEEENSDDDMSISMQSMNSSDSESWMNQKKAPFEGTR
jgi:hypothetical protein